MDPWLSLMLGPMLLLGRIGAFFAVGPLFSWAAMPVRLRAGLAVATTGFVLFARPPGLIPAAGWTDAGLLLAMEILHGLALGLIVAVVFMTVQQAGRIVGLQTGMGDAGIIDPITGEDAPSLDMIFEIAFAMLFLAADGHHLLVGLLWRSYDIFPLGSPPDAAGLASAVVEAGSTMLTLALRLAAPVLAAFLVLGVVLAVLARALPEMNVLMTSFPLRVGMGMVLAGLVLPTMDGAAVEIGDWMQRAMGG